MYNTMSELEDNMNWGKGGCAFEGAGVLNLGTGADRWMNGRTDGRRRGGWHHFRGFRNQ